jgi:SAM-dependent MidA family methyltransferase
MSTASAFLRIFEREAGPSKAMPFSDFMRLALYDPSVGYYGAGKARVGRHGDFVTSVSTGSCFGQLLATQALEVWERCGKPTRFSVVEQGAHSGMLADDFTEYAERRWPDFARSIRYLEIELSPAEPNKKVERTQRLSDLTTDGMECWFFFCNELVDAFPVARIRWSAEHRRWDEIFVRWSETDGRFEEELQEVAAGSKLGSAIAAMALELSYPDGYTTEICLEIEPWARQLGQLFDRGMALVIDYGFWAEDYYHPDRADGTLQCYRKHRKDIGSLEFPGDCDISAHVDWSAVRAAGSEAGLDYVDFADQGAFLTRLAKPILLEMEGSGDLQRSWIRQFQTLTHPGMMGRAFGAMGFTKGLKTEGWRGFDSSSASRLGSTNR